MYFKSWPSFNNPSAVDSGKLVGLDGDLSTLSLHDRKPDGPTRSGGRLSSGDRPGRESKRSEKSQSPTTRNEHISIRTGSKDSLSNREETTSDSTLTASDASADVSQRFSKCRDAWEDAEQQPGERRNGGLSPRRDPASTNACRTDSRDVFIAKYQELKLLDEGGYGKVFSGYREDDKLKVAIKHVSQDTVERTPQVLHEKMSGVPVEVALLIKVGAGPEAKSSNVTPALLDWFDLEEELILVFERPACSMNLVDYISSRQDKLTEDEVKTILTQLLDAAIEMHSKGVFHRDIKLENILIERKAGIPRVRFLDFGCGTTCTPGQKFNGGIGTKEYTPPEWHERRCYTAVPTTVWQLGVVMYALLHRELPFTDASRIIRHNPLIRPEMSHEGKHFLRNCLIKSPEQRPTLEKLRIHPWLR